MDKSSLGYSEEKTLYRQELFIVPSNQQESEQSQNSRKSNHCETLMDPQWKECVTARECKLISSIFLRNNWTVSYAQMKLNFKQQFHFSPKQQAPKSAICIFFLYGIPTQIKLINHIKFSYLSVLDLSGNNIDSIEPLVKLQSSTLTYFRLHCNQITNVRSLRKCYFPYLYQFRTNQNKCSEYYSVSTCKFPYLEEADIRTGNQGQFGPHLLSRGWLLKLQSARVRCITMGPLAHLRDRNAEVMLCGKYTNYQADIQQIMFLRYLIEQSSDRVTEQDQNENENEENAIESSLQNSLDQDVDEAVDNAANQAITEAVNVAFGERNEEDTLPQLLENEGDYIDSNQNKSLFERSQQQQQEE